MLYVYSCPKCSAKVERICKIAERDDQTCETQIVTKLRLDGFSLMPDGSLESDGAVEASTVCGAKLVREEISLSANMGYAWKP